MSGASLKIDYGRVEAVVRRQGRAAAKRAADITAERARANVIKKGRVNTGAMRDAYVVEQSGPMEYIVSNEMRYHWWQERGRRGFSAQPGKFLRFKPKGSSTFVFAKHVGPVAPGRFLEDALAELKPSDFGTSRGGR